MSNKNLTIQTVVEKNKIASATPFLVLLELQIADASTGTIVETVFGVNNNENVVYQGETYYAFPFDVTLKQEEGAAPEVTLTTYDYQRFLLGKLSQYGGITGSRAILRVVNAANLTAPVEFEERFEVTRASATEFTVSLTLGMENPLRRYYPRRIQMRDRCAWRYKSAECGYAGGMATCDLSLQGPNGCSAHNNAANYGGFPGLVNRGRRA